MLKAVILKYPAQVVSDVFGKEIITRARYN